MDRLEKAISDHFSDVVKGAAISEKIKNNVINNLESEVSSRVGRETNFLKRKTRVLFKAAVVCGMCLSILAGSLTLSPAFAEYAKNVPILKIAVEWVQAFRGYEGIQNAQNHGYVPVPPITVEKDGFTITIDNIILEDNRFNFTTAIKGKEISENAKIPPNGILEQGGKIPEFDFVVRDLTIHKSNTMGGQAAGGLQKDIYGDGFVYVQQWEQHVNQELVASFLNSNVGKVTFDVTIRNPGQKSEHFMEINIPFDKNNVALSKKVYLGQELQLSLKDASIQKFEVKEFIISPTRMQMALNVEMEPGSYIEHLEKSYIKNSKGEIFKMEEGPFHSNKTLIFYPSFYFEKEQSDFSLHLGTIYITKYTGEKLSVSIKEKYPKTITLGNKRVTILGTRYEPGRLIIEVKNTPDLQDIQLDIQPYLRELFNKSERKRQWEKLQAENPVVAGGDGKAVPKGMTDNPQVPYNLNDGVFKFVIPALPQEIYEFPVQRCNIPVSIDEDVPLNI